MLRAPRAAQRADRLRLLGDRDEQPLELRLVGRGRHPVLSPAQRRDLGLELRALRHERSGARIRRRASTLRAERHRAREGAIADRGVLGQQQLVGLVHASDLLLRVRERLEHGDASVLVGVGLVTRQPADERCGEPGLVPLERGPRRRDDHPSRTRERGTEVTAAARRVHEHHPLAREAGEPTGEIGCRGIRARQAHARVRPFARAMADEEHEHDVSRCDAA
jgi:hypothetical protein